MKTGQRERSIFRVTWIGFGVNILLTTGKLLAGIFGRSGAMIADAIHSLSDFLTDLVVILFVKLSAKPKDEDHHYGHGKYETLATVFIGLALLAVAVVIFINSINQIKLAANGSIIERPGCIALIAAGVSIVVKEILYLFTIRVANRINSPVLKANAWHHRSDAFSSIGTLLGIGGAYFLGDRWRILDPIAAIIVSLLITKVAYELIVPGLNELLERSLPKEWEREILSIVMEDKQLHDPHNLKTRRIGANIAIEVHVRVPGTMTVEESHLSTVNLEQRLKEKYGANTQVIVHVEPIK